MLGYIFKLRLKSTVLILCCFTAIICFLQLYIINYPQKNSNPVLIWWTPFMFEMEKIIKCGDHTCLLTKNRNHFNYYKLGAYLFYGSNVDVSDLPLPRTETPWAILHEESPKNLAFFLHKQGQQLFNITATFSRYSHFPLPLQYLKNTDLLLDMQYYIPVINKNKLLNHIAPVLYIQSDCDTPIQRDSYVEELMKYISVDSYGACLKNKELLKGLSSEKVLENLYDKHFMKFVAQYKFIIAMENAVCDDYITEKLWRPLIVGSIPIYLGSPSVKDWLPHNNSAILMQDFNSMQELAEYIKKVNSDDNLYVKYMAHKTVKKVEERIPNPLLLNTLFQGDYGMIEDEEYTIPAFECHVCRSIHEKTIKKINVSVYNCPTPKSKNGKENSWKFHWEIGKCEAKSLKYFIEDLKLSNFTKTILEKQTYEYFNKKEC